MVDLSPRAHRLHILAGIVAALLVFSLLVAIPMLSREPLSQVDLIKQRGHLTLLTLNGASTYYVDANGENGFEYQLARQFADHLGVDLRVKSVESFQDIYHELIFDGGDLGAAGLSQEDADIPPGIAFGPGYHEVKPQLLYRKDLQQRPKKLEDLASGILEVIDGSSHAATLQRLAAQHPELSWRSNANMATEELIELVDEGLIDFILADSHEIALQRRFFPQLRVGFQIGEPRQLRWAVRDSEDRSLVDALNAYFTEITDDGRLAQLSHRFFGQVDKFNYSDLQTFSQHLRDRLPRYIDMFQQEAAKKGLDWHLLAAIGYQESHWNPRAKSPTGVRGLMMLTLDTAKMVKVNNRLDAAQSIAGGAAYFKRVLKKIPERIAEPDRTWLALASYNVGFGHLEDARKITENNGDDPDKWIDVKKYLPWLSRKKIYKHTKHGYARGWEPVKYVENIRKYYDLLVWIDSRENGEPSPPLSDTVDDTLSMPPSF